MNVIQKQNVQTALKCPIHCLLQLAETNITERDKSLYVLCLFYHLHYSVSFLSATTKFCILYRLLYHFALFCKLLIGDDKIMYALHGCCIISRYSVNVFLALTFVFSLTRRQNSCTHEIRIYSSKLLRTTNKRLVISLL